MPELNIRLWRHNNLLIRPTIYQLHTAHYIWLFKIHLLEIKTKSFAVMAQTAGSKYSASTQRSAMDARGGGSTAPGRPAVRFECTYKMKPDRKFMVGAAKQIIEDILTAQLESQSYDPPEEPSPLPWACRRYQAPCQGIADPTIQDHRPGHHRISGTRRCLRGKPVCLEW